MSWPVTVLGEGGVPVSESASGTPMTPVEEGGMPVTVVQDGGMPVTFVGNDFQLLPQGIAILSKGFAHPSMTVARSGTATYIDAGGVLQDAAANTLRYDYSNPNGAGWLIEAGSTNPQRNNTMAGASAPSTLPTNWSLSSLLGLNYSVVSVGAANGFDDIYFRLYGTPTSTGSVSLFMETTTGAAAAATETWSNSVYCALAGGAVTNFSNILLQTTARTAAGAFVGSQTKAFTPTATFQRISDAYTLPATTARIQPIFNFGVVNTLAVDITLRISLPQPERRGYPSSVIKTLGSAAVTRADDDVSLLLTDLPQWNPVEGTLLIDFVAGPSIISKTLLDLHDGTANNRMRIASSGSGGLSLLVTSGGATQVLMFSSAPAAANARSKVAVSLKQDAFYLSLNGAAPSEDLSGLVPVVDRIQFGTDLSKTASMFLNGHLSSVRYSAVALTTANLIALTS